MDFAIGWWGPGVAKLVDCVGSCDDLRKCCSAGIWARSGEKFQNRESVGDVRLVCWGEELLIDREREGEPAERSGTERSRQGQKFLEGVGSGVNTYPGSWRLLALNTITKIFSDLTSLLFLSWLLPSPLLDV